MKIVNLEAIELGIVGSRMRSTTAGLTSGYQRTANSTSGLSAVETTGGFLLIDIATLPWYPSFQLDEPNIEFHADLVAPNQDELSAAYKEMAIEDNRIAEESLLIALEVWPAWEE
jgi:hypothetical protein